MAYSASDEKTKNARSETLVALVTLEREREREREERDGISCP